VASTPGLTAGRDSASKGCSKCNRVLPLSDFSKGPNRTGTYPSCRECERQHIKDRLAKNPLCYRCKKNPHMPNTSECYECSRKRRDLPPRRWVKRKTDLEWCPKCGLRPRVEKQAYCALCKLEYQKALRTKRWRDKHPIGGPRQTSNARQYATGLLYRGKIRRGPCVFCGDPGQEFHHYDYLPKTRNFEDVCCDCHDAAHKILKLLLTIWTGRV
jgi:hypothetical protein